MRKPKIASSQVQREGLLIRQYIQRRFARYAYYSKLPLQIGYGGLCGPCGPSFTSGFTDTDHGSTAIPHDAADIDDVEADQPLDHEQVRDGADREAGPLLGVTGIVGAGLHSLLTDIGAEMAELHGSPHGGVLISLPWIDRLTRVAP
jgi:hypothetical protein